ncbi:MAG: CHRD domain-containing protein [Pseudomonadota bacterium]
MKLVLPALVAVFALTTGTADALLLKGAASLTPDQEVVAPGGPDPALTSTAFGLASFDLDTATNTLSKLSLIVKGIDPSDLFDVGGGNGPVHIHDAPVGANGGIVLAIPTGFDALPFANGGFAFRADSIVITDAAEAAIVAGNGYFNIHTDAFEAGEIRGQIHVTPIPAGFVLLGTAIAGVGWLGRRKRQAA